MTTPPIKPSVERFGAELRRCRKEAGLSQTRLADHLQCGQSLIGHIERGTRTPQLAHAQKADEIFGRPEHFVKLWRRIHYAPGGPQWYARWIDEIEPGAQMLRSWDPMLIPGLLQIEDYARAVIAGDLTPPKDVDDRVRARLARQVIFDRDDPPELWVLIAEGAIRRLIGDSKLMVRQLDHLIAMAAQPKVTIQIVPEDASTTAGLMGGFIIAESSGAMTAVSIESAGLGEVSTEADLVASIWGRYDRLRADTHRPVDSLKMIKEVRDRWSE